MKKIFTYKKQKILLILILILSLNGCQKKDKSNIEKQAESSIETIVEKSPGNEKDTYIETIDSSTEVETIAETVIETFTDTIHHIDRESTIEKESDTLKGKIEITFPKDKYKNIKGYGGNSLMAYISKKIINDDYTFPLKEVESFLTDEYFNLSAEDKEIHLSKYFYNSSFQNDMVGIYTGNFINGDPIITDLEENLKKEISEKLIKLDKKVEEILDPYDFSQMSTYEKSKTVFDIVCNHLEYDYEIFEYMNYTYPNEKYDNLSEEELDALSKTQAKRENAYDSVMTGMSICSGYSKLYALLSRAVGLETLYVDGIVYLDSNISDEGQAHAWNYVRMDDGNWYLVDSTFGDNVNIDEKYLWLHKTPEDNRKIYEAIMLPDNFIKGTNEEYAGYYQEN